MICLCEILRKTNHDVDHDSGPQDEDDPYDIDTSIDTIQANVSKLKFSPPPSNTCLPIDQ